MSSQSSATVRRDSPIPTPQHGLWWGFLGVSAFALTMPLTRIALEGGGLSPLFIGSGRAVVAALIAAAALLFTRQRLPSGRQWVSVAIVAGGAVLGFPLLTSLALDRTSASHGAVVIALLPAATAVVAVLRAHERPSRRFWVAAAAGALATVGFVAVQGGGAGSVSTADLLLLAAVVVCAIAYAEGGVLARALGSWQTIAWALVLASPVTAVLAAVAVLDHPPVAGPTGWLCFGYLGVVSTFLGFVAWYRGLGIGPIAQVSQVQLAQPVMSIGWAALLLHEQITLTTVMGGGAVVGCALLAVRSRDRSSRRGRTDHSARPHAQPTLTR